MKTAVVLLNFGTPARPTAPAVAAFLQQMLTDRRVLDLPWPLRFVLGGLLIPLLRSARSAAAYRKIWLAEGSPLRMHTLQLTDALQQRLQARSSGQYRVWAAMRLGQPSIAKTLNQVRNWRPHKVLLLPLYPQYASSSTGTALEVALRQLSRWELPPQMTVVGEYATAPGFIDAVAAPALAGKGKTQLRDCDAVLFSFHGLPESHVRKACATGGGNDCPCQGKEAPGKDGATGDGAARDPYCYRAGCWATARALAARLNLPDEKWHLGFQSRLGPGWLQPHTDELVKQLAAAGNKKLVVFCPSFTTDCLETLEEVGIGLSDDFRAGGGQELSLMPCPNASAAWVDFLASLIE